MLTFVYVFFYKYSNIAINKKEDQIILSTDLDEPIKPKFTSSLKGKPC
jgi:hypothetical protein